MAKYDGLIIPRSYNDYINKSNPIDVSQALQLTGVMDNAPAAQSTKPAKSGGIFAANAVIMADNATLSGVAISAGSVVRVLFTAALTGSDATTGLILTYNGNAYAVKVGKNGALAAFVASEISSGVFKYLQAYTTLELMFDGTQFIIIGNPVVLSSADYTIYADGKGVVNTVTSGNMHSVTSNAVYERLKWFKVIGANLVAQDNIPIPENWHELYILFGTPYYKWSGFITRELTELGNYYYTFNNDYANTQQSVGCTITVAQNYKSLSISAVVCKQNNASNTGSIYIYAR